MSGSRLLLIAVLIVAPLAQAQSDGEKGTHYEGKGTVRKVDPAGGRIVISHERIPNLWPAMTMEFEVASKALLEGVKPGEKVDFTLLKAGSAYTVTRLKPRL